MVLSACSTYFEQLFLEHLEANPIVIMRETSFNDLVIIVEFMYKGEINVSQVRLVLLRRLAVARHHVFQRPPTNTPPVVLLTCLTNLSY